MSDQNPAPGWYPAPHANNEQRYWDGVQWIEPQQPVAAPVIENPTAAYPTSPFAEAATTAFPTSPFAADAAGVTPAASPEPAKKSKKKAWIVGGSIAAGLIVISGINAAVGGGGSSNVADEKPAASTVTTVEEEPAEEPEPVVMVAVPDVTGVTAAEALVTLAAAGLNPPVISALSDPLAKVVSTSPAAGTEVEEKTEITLTLEEKPVFTLAQQNAIGSAKNYLSLMGFSRTGLIGQLEFEGFSTDEATFGVDNAGADWNAEAAQSAEQYLAVSTFSRQGLYDQLAFEGFQASEIDFGLAAVGY